MVKFAARFTRAILSAVFFAILVSSAPSKQKTKSSTKTLAASASVPKLVFAHYMVFSPSTNNTVQGFIADITMAQSHGIDAFVLNTARYLSTQDYVNNAANMYAAAQQLNSGFKLFFSADMSDTSSMGLKAADVISMVSTYANHPNQLKISGKVFLSTFLGESVTFSQSSVAAGWQNDVFTPLSNQGISVFFVPFFNVWNPVSPPVEINYPRVQDVANLYNEYPFLSGLFSWLAWPFFNNTQEISPANDQNYVAASHAAGKIYLAPVSPWFSPHAGGDNTIWGNYKGGHMFAQRWKDVTAAGVDMVEIVTWNDYVEGSYVDLAPASAPADDATDYYHLFYLDLATYFIPYYKTGSYPSITTDKVYFFYRKYPKAATATADSNSKPTGWNYLDDDIYVTAILASAGQIQISSGGTVTSFNLQAGYNEVSTPFNLGVQKVSLYRNGALVGSLTGNLQIQSTPTVYNFNVHTECFQIGAPNTWCQPGVF